MKREELKAVLQTQKELYLKPDDRILFVVDEGYDNAPVEEVFSDQEYEIVRIPKVERPGQDYELDEALLEGKTLGWLITSVSISHARSTKKMLDRKMFLISNPGITPDWPAILDPKNRQFCREKAEAILQAIGGDVGGTVLVSAVDGTEIWLRVPKGNWGKEIGERGGIGTNGPYGELVTAPYWTEGIFILSPGEFMTNPLNQVEEKIQLTIENNRVVKIEGGAQAKILRELLEKAGDEKAFSLGEFAFGLNPGRPEKLHRSVIAEKLSGGVHIAIGTNAVCLNETCPEIDKFPYGRYSAGVHIDCIKFSPLVFFRNERKISPVPILKDGKFLV